MVAFIKKKNADMLVSSAKVVGGNLILSLPDADIPVVWRMELGSVKASALEVRPAAGGGAYSLMLKTPKGESHEIAPYTLRESAVAALMEVSQALNNAHGQMQADAAAPIVTLAAPAVKEKNGFKWMAALAGVVALIFLFSYVGRLAPSPSSVSAPMADMATATSGGASVTSGVAQDADALLGGMQ